MAEPKHVVGVFWPVTTQELIRTAGQLLHAHGERSFGRLVARKAALVPDVPLTDTYTTREPGRRPPTRRRK